MYDNVFCSGCGNQVCGCCGCCATAGCERCSCPSAEQEADENPPEILANVKVSGDGLCEDCRLDLARAAVASTRRCASCGEPEETSQGIIDLDDNGLCDDCRERRERALIYAQDVRQSLDFDFSMNY